MLRTVLRQRPRLPTGATLAFLLGTAATASFPTTRAEAFALPTADAPREESAPASGPVLKPLPAGHDELVFRGENAVRNWPVYLTRTEAARTGTFQLALLNTVSLQPDRSMLRLSINGHVLATLPLRSADKVAIVPVRIPAGVLVPGFNAVQVTVAMAHRVDCSVKATYELWSLLDPAQTGFALPADAAFAARGLDDLAGEPLAADGTTRIHLRMARDPDPASLERAALVVAGLVERGRLVRPVVDVGPGPGSGPGLDLAIGAGPGFRDGGVEGDRVVSREPNYALTRNPRTNRPTVTLTGEDDDLDAAAARFAGPHASDPIGSPAAIDLVAQAGGVPIEGDSLTPFSAFDNDGESFAGRHYRASLPVVLPADFYPGNYGKARLLLDAVHAGNLAPGSDLVFRVNGSLVSSLPIAEGTPERLEHEQVDLPLRFFRPGPNVVEIEGIATTEADRTCDLATMPTSPRISIAGTSELEFPHFAHLATLQQIPGALRFGPEPLDLYLPESGPASLGAAMTLVANIAAQQGAAGAVRMHFDAPSAADRPGLVIAPAGQLPERLAREIEALSRPAGAAAPTASAPVDAAQGGLEAAATANRAAFRSASERWLAAGEAWFRARGFFYAPIVGGRQVLDADPASSLVLAAIEPETVRRRIGTLDLPRFATSGRRWIVATAGTPAVIQAGLVRLVADGDWHALTGQAVSLDPGTGQVRSLQPMQVSYVMPDHIDVADIRPVLGGIVSNNIALSVGLLMLLLSLLGVSTHALVRSRGARGR